MEDVCVGASDCRDVFRVYKSSPVPVRCRDVFRVYKSGSQGPLLVLLHGGGHSALSWAVFTTAITSRVRCRVLAMDLRGHGATSVREAGDFSTQTMSSDVANVVRACYGETPPPVVLIGHGVGGAIAVHTASNVHVPNTVGLVAIDVVEGSAMDALHSIQNFLKLRPKSFKSMEQAIEWRYQVILFSPASMKQPLHVPDIITFVALAALVLLSLVLSALTLRRKKQTNGTSLSPLSYF
ncbi:hypothetical protein NL108_017574 [Boleophthalmus pectinirostris]|nr:hypothetical protein NL108_017574 [Boleophthalmus pectinirostris]